MQTCKHPKAAFGSLKSGEAVACDISPGLSFELCKPLVVDHAQEFSMVCDLSLRHWVASFVRLS